MDVYKTIFDTWRSQVDSSWQRSSYFAVFETAAIGGSWTIIRSTRPLEVGAGIVASFGGIVLTVIWLLSSWKMWKYVRHWWDSLREAEKYLAPFDFAEQLQKKSKTYSIPHRLLALAVPLIFGMAWAAMFLTAIVRFFCFIPK